jgi:hypothetical protein
MPHLTAMRERCVQFIRALKFSLWAHTTPLKFV